MKVKTDSTGSKTVNVEKEKTSSSAPLKESPKSSSDAKAKTADGIAIGKYSCHNFWKRIIPLTLFIKYLNRKKEAKETRQMARSLWRRSNSKYDY